jgi:N-acetylglucosamine-6-phosphate deacetylase
MYALVHGNLYTAKNILENRTLLIEGNSIQAVLSPTDALPDCPIIDLEGLSIAPGFIDLQLNGCGGVMFNDAIAPETLQIMHETNLKSGTTSYLPTLITTSDDDMLRSIQVVRKFRQHSPHNVLGLHLEGPYLNPKRKGIHNASYIRKPDRAMLEKIAAAGGETVRLLTLAPEMAAPEDTKLLVDAGIVVSIGHSDATYEEAQAGFEAGMQMVTHLFNAMSPWLGRQPGVVGATLARSEIYAGIIADGYHTHFASIELVYRLKPRLILVTDATPPVGTQMDSFWIGGQQVFYRDGKCVAADGTLGGSALTMIEAIANCVRHVHIPLTEALRMASTYPAQLLGLDHKLGDIAPGYIANLAIFTDDLEIAGVVDRGNYQPNLVTTGSI